MHNIPFKKHIRHVGVHTLVFLRSIFSLGRLPSFIILGAQKAGTTTMAQYLSFHPKISLAFEKEVHYFDRYATRPISWYKAFFKHKTNTPSLVGEGTPAYLFIPGIETAIHKSVPEASFIVMLRNPTTRAYSHYLHEYSRGREHRTFLDCITKEIADLETQGFSTTSYVSRGLYADQLSRWFSLFPTEQFHIIKSEDFFANTAHAMDSVYAFLGLASFEHHLIKGKQSYNTSDNTNYPKCTKEAIDLLDNFYQSKNEALASLLGWRSPIW